MRTLIIASMISSAAAVVGIDCSPACDGATQSCNMGVCECLPGYREQIFPDLPCVDIDECTENIGICGPDSKCTNVNGGYECKCEDGFENVGGICVDLDECNDPHACDPSVSVCVNLPGSFECSPLPCDDPNQIRDPVTFRCEDPPCPPDTVFVAGMGCVMLIDECSTVTGVCGPNAKCTDLPVGYECSCLRGFEDLGGLCVDTDECMDPHACDLSVSVCINLPGSFECSPLPCDDPNQIRDPVTFVCEDPCTPGFVFNGMGCDDIDECLLPNTCDPLKVCVNTEGSYRCVDPMPPTPPARCADVETRSPTSKVWPSSATRKEFGGHFSFNSIPQYLEGTKMYLPEIMQGDDLHLTCCEDECQFFVALYHCLPCSSTLSGGFNGALSAASWDATSCAPTFLTPVRDNGPKPMVVFHAVLGKGDTHTFSLGAASTDVPLIAVFQKDVPEPVSCPINRGPFAPQEPRSCSLC